MIRARLMELDGEFVSDMDGECGAQVVTRRVGGEIAARTQVYGMGSRRDAALLAAALYESVRNAGITRREIWRALRWVRRGQHEAEVREIDG